MTVGPVFELAPKNDVLVAGMNDVHLVKDAVASGNQGRAPPRRAVPVPPRCSTPWASSGRAKELTPSTPTPTTRELAGGTGGDDRTCLLFHVDYHRSRPSSTRRQVARELRRPSVCAGTQERARGRQPVLSVRGGRGGHRAARAFYPLAGRLRLTLGTSDRYELRRPDTAAPRRPATA
jgi:hypothetical protein